MFYWHLWITFVLSLSLYVMIKQDQTLSKLHNLAKQQDEKIQELYKQIKEQDKLLEEYKSMSNIRIDLFDSPD